ncbi:tRNA (adenosine(37)-N6)-threonylcarbamoyltransferase complex dimerization subunit type 1 TsaB [Roseateles cellulosilyticus]|uniref:tRNA (Adenosine(37)-N6)-threonylcarbamoyltransferase complex dimerization subunit type 1 TsaB n=1 Tax=Pelomonas cellulosilytica TaxID=2906762 RepID=A0ABS8Y0T8_9BURK|nr:tRNA (adenosine(37)-N6)-threonylcarbamoyltransferase complex dimerization subunit type 1 TsaB [Pelomonas sp. P8]MCE4557223.1 tRNA (adenosine(37)-N6)-threonylcarbamoyltransferase complex dimerization subunit type 1 TsaB [Pelomonas sp. P8]
MPVLLALDSATDTMALALVTPGQTQVFEAAGGAQASARMLPEVRAMLANAGVAMADLDAIAFGQGPGAFTGLRTACAVAQGLAFGLDRPVLAVDSLMLVAEDARGQGAGDDVWVAMDARIGEIYAGRYRWADDGWQVVEAPALYAPDALVAHWDEPAAVAGTALSEYAAALGPLPRAWPQAASRAGALGRLALAAWQRGDRRDAAEALPVYVRDKVALTTAERERRA